MTPNTSSRRQRYATLGLPAAVLGALAGVLVAAPAGADVAADSSSTARLNGVPHRIAPAEAPPTDYVVAPGDTIFAIAQRFGLRTADVLAWNGLDASSVILPGQELRLDAPQAAASTPAPTAPPASAPATYTVAAGDTPFAIAQRHGKRGFQVRKGMANVAKYLRTTAMGQAWRREQGRLLSHWDVIELLIEKSNM